MKQQQVIVKVNTNEITKEPQSHKPITITKTHDATDPEQKLLPICYFFYKECDGNVIFSFTNSFASYNPNQHVKQT